MEEEFLIGGLKPKKLAFQQAGGSRSTAAASGKNTPGSGKVAQVESALDPQRAQNINIMLAKFGKRSLDAIAQVRSKIIFLSVICCCIISIDDLYGWMIYRV